MDGNFGINNSLETPIGIVKMGESQYQKFFDKKRSSEFGMAVETLKAPDVILIEPSKAKEGQETERPYSYVFVKTFNRNGEKIKFYASVTVKRDNMEVSVSSHYMNPSKVVERLTKFDRLYTNEALLSNSSEMHLAEQQDAVPDLLPTQENNVSQGKGTENFQTNKKTETEKPQKSEKKVSKQRVGGSTMSMEADATEMMMRDALVETTESAGIEVSTDWEAGQRVLDAYRELARLMGGGKKKSTSADPVPGETSPFKAGFTAEVDAAKVAKNLETSKERSMKSF